MLFVREVGHVLFFIFCSFVFSTHTQTNNTGTSASSGDDICETCPLMYSFPLVPVGHCEQPLLAYVLVRGVPRFEREAREFPSFHFFMFQFRHSNHKSLSLIAQKNYSKSKARMQTR